MSGQSNVGNAAVYEANEQRTVSDSQIEEEKKEARFHEGKENSHLATDSSTLSTYLSSSPLLCLHRTAQTNSLTTRLFNSTLLTRLQRMSARSRTS
jgi:hypothetical protein